MREYPEDKACCCDETKTGTMKDSPPYRYILIHRSL